MGSNTHAPAMASSVAFTGYRLTAPALSGSHQSRFSRYQRTVSASPVSNGTCGRVAQLGGDLRPVDGVAAVVALAVGHRLDHRLVGADGVEQPVR